MKLIEINSYVPQIASAPHKIYVVEFTLAELGSFRLDSARVLKRMEPFTDVDDDTNLIVTGLDGDKGEYGHGNVEATHGIIMDFRPLAVHVVFWVKPPVEAVDVPADIVPVTRKDG